MAEPRERTPTETFHDLRRFSCTCDTVRGTVVTQFECLACFLRAIEAMERGILRQAASLFCDLCGAELELQRVDPGRWIHKGRRGGAWCKASPVHEYLHRED